LKNNRTGKEGKKQRLFGLEIFTPHDLRRTGSTLMTALGVPRLHVEKTLNHTGALEGEADATPIYDRYHYWAEKKAALEKLERELRLLIDGKPSTIVHLPNGQPINSGALALCA
jgi:hypothetical protein